MTASEPNRSRTVGADILERLEADAKVWPRSRDLMTEAAAEIGRLRGEVARWKTLAEDAQVMHETAIEVDALVADIDATAPAMPNGVEGLQRWSLARGSDGARWSVYLDHDPNGEWVKFSHVQQLALAADLSRASDNRDAAGVEARRHAANEWADMATNGVQWLRNIRDGVSTVDEALAEMESNMVRVRALNDAAQAAPAAVPAGEAVARERSGVTAVFRICTAYEAGVGKGIQGRDVGNPYKPNTDEHEAWGYGFKQGRSVDEDEAELEFRPGDPDSPMPSQRAPAPVQAAAQEGEQVQGEADR